MLSRACALVAIATAKPEYREDGTFPAHKSVDTSTTMGSIPSIEDVLAKYVPEKELKEVKRVLHGKGTTELDVPTRVQALADAGDFQVVLEDFTQNALAETMRGQRKVRVGTIQTGIVHQPDSGKSIKEQYEAIVERTEELIDTAAAAGVQVLGLQEAWTTPFFFATREKYPYAELAECPKTGPSAQLISRKAREYNMVIVSPILERDMEHHDKIWNTAVVFGNKGNYIGLHRKNHIPRINDFNEATYYTENDAEVSHPVFETEFGRIAINICYGRHHPLNWMAFGMNGAEIVFNPSATIGALSEPMWGVEARAAAIFNSYFTVNTNRVGTEHYPNVFTSGTAGEPHRDFGPFYGSSYIAAPDAARSTGLSRVRDGLLAADVDLNQVRQLKDIWMLQVTGRHSLYAKFLNRFVQPDFKPDIVRDPSLDTPADAASRGEDL